MFVERYGALLDADCINNAPQTVAREVILEVAPHLSPFDVLMLGFAVTSTKIEVDGKQWRDATLAKLRKRSMHIFDV